MMADHASDGTLSSTFGKVAKHTFSATMIFMMASMALPALGALADPTLADAGLALVDHYGQMFMAPFGELDTIGQVVDNTLEGNFSASYELGGGHGAHVGGEHIMEQGAEHAADHSASAGAGHLDMEHYGGKLTEWVWGMKDIEALGGIQEQCPTNLLDCFEEYYHPPGHH